MKKTDKIGTSQKTRIELISAIALKKKEIVENKTKQFLGNLKDTSVFRKLRREVAQLSTSLTQTK